MVRSQTVPVGYRASFAAEPIYTGEWSALFAVRVTITWGTVDGGFIAQKRDAFQSSADHVRWSPAPRCSVYARASGSAGMFFASVG